MAGLVLLSEVIAQVEGHLLATINAGGVSQYTVLTETERWSVPEISDACLDADAQICKTFLQKSADGRRVPFLATAVVANYGNVPSRVGEIDSILVGGLSPIRSDPITIQRDLSNVRGFPNGTYVPKFWMFGDQLVHNGAHFGVAGATVTYADFTKTSACQAPSEYAAAVIAIATAALMAKAGNHADSSEFYMKLGMSYLADIARGETSLVPMPTTQEAQKQMAVMGQQQQAAGGGGQ